LASAATRFKKMFDFSLLALPTDGHAPVSLDDAPWVWKNPQAGVYDNVFDDLDTTPVHPYHYGEPVDVSPDLPYANYSAVDGTTALSYDGTCNPMPGWEPTFNPSSSAGCHLNPMYNEPGLGSGASYGSGYPTAAPQGGGMQPSLELAVVPLVVQGPAPKQELAVGTTAKSSPGHVLLVGHALMFGALTATTESVIKGSAHADAWAQRFNQSSEQAAAAVSPVSAYMLREHVLKKQ